MKQKCPLPCLSNIIRLEVTNQGGIIMSQFVYLYRGAERGRSPEKMQEMMQKWMTWMKQLTEKGSYQGPRPAPRTYRQASQRQAEDSDRRARSEERRVGKGW